jgi:isoquinoline 1-oxidoreductase beta subunit
MRRQKAFRGPVARRSTDRRLDIHSLRVGLTASLGAAACTVLVAAAAQQRRCNLDTFNAQGGMVMRVSSKQSANYRRSRESGREDARAAEVDAQDLEGSRLIGKPVKRLDSPGKVYGAAKLSLDVRVSDMIYACIVSCPVVGGKLSSLDDTNARKVAVVKRIVKFDGLMSVCGSSASTLVPAAKRGAAALFVQWEEGPVASVTTAQLCDDMAKAARQKTKRLMHRAE